MRDDDEEIEVKLKPSAEEIESYNEHLLRKFIEEARGLTGGMVLIGLRETNDHTQVELRAGATVGNMYRCASAILESLIQDNKIHNENELELAKVMAKTLSIMAGDIGIPEDDEDDNDGGPYNQNRH